MDENIIEIDGKRINLSELSDEELMELHKEVKSRESKYKKMIKKYEEKYTFLQKKNK